MTDTATETKSCRDCGVEVAREIPYKLRDTAYGDLLNRVPILCGVCSLAQEIALAHEEAHRENTLRDERLRERRQDCRIPEIYRSLTWKDIEIDNGNRAAVEDAKRWGRGELKGLVLSGDVGIGKTLIAAVAANALMRRRRVRWFSASKLMAQARAGFKNPSRDEVTELLINERMALVLDDIDKIAPTEYALDIFFQVIDSRTANATPLLVTTNKNYTELKAQFGEPIASRLATCAGHRIVGSDRRRARP